MTSHVGRTSGRRAGLRTRAAGIAFATVIAALPAVPGAASATLSYEPYAIVVRRDGYARRPQSYDRPRWELVVRMDVGGMRTLSQAYEPALREGDRVRIYGTQVELAD